MNILILNFILSTAVDGKIIRRNSNRDTMIYNMARGFVKAGHTVTLLASEEFRPLEEERNDFDVIYFKSHFPRILKPWLLPFPKGLGKYLRSNHHKFDMVLSVESFSIPTLIASVYCKKKTIIWQEMSYHQRLLHNIPSKIWHNIAMPCAINGITTVPQSEAAQKFISRYQKSTTGQCVPHGVNDDIFVPYPENAPERYFIVIAMLIRRKRIDRIIEKFARFIRNSRHSDYKLKIIGEGEELDNLVSLSKQLGIEDNVEFLGFKSHTEFAAIGKRATAFLVDTDRDLNMVSVSESFANGTPVLMNTIPNTSFYATKFNLGIAKDHWDWTDLDEMISRYNEFHQNCIKHRHKFTNVGCGNSLVQLFIAATRPASNNRSVNI